MDVIIREAVLDDAEAIAEILRDTGLFTYLEDEPRAETVQRIETHLDLCRADDSHSVYLAQHHSLEAVGYAAVHWLPYLFLKGPEGYLSELFVKERYRGLGAGNRLLRIVTEEGRKRGCYRLNLVANNRREAYHRGFYRKRGWIERDRMSNFVYLYD